MLQSATTINPFNLHNKHFLLMTSIAYLRMLAAVQQAQTVLQQSADATKLSAALLFHVAGHPVSEKWNNLLFCQF
jgi:hypothetical protein